MKKLIFIDNDDMSHAKVDSNRVKRYLDRAELPEKYIKSMKIIPDFRHIEEDKAIELIFNTKHAICTYSMYTAVHYNSIGQLISMLEYAAISAAKGIVYLDASGNFAKDLEFQLQQNNGDSLKILNAIEDNQIITFKDNDWKRVTVDLKGYYKSPFKLTTIDLKTILL
jgi:hypothetical protein